MTVSNQLQGAVPSAKGYCVAVGLFDGLHIGHMAVIKRAATRAREEGLLPAVFTFTIEQVTPLSKTGATRLLSERMMLRTLEETGVSYVLRPRFEEFRNVTAAKFMEDILYNRLNGKYIFCGENFRFGKLAAAGAADLREMAGALGMQAEIVPTVLLDREPVNSTRIRRTVSEGDMAAVNRMLGRPFAIDFPVVYGNRIGRTLDFPTINQPFPDDFSLPKRGVYASMAYVKGEWRSAVTNVGVKPTVGSDRVLAETYIHGYDGDLYGQGVEVRFYEFLRPEQKLRSLQELRERIKADAARAERITRLYQT